MRCEASEAYFNADTGLAIKPGVQLEAVSISNFKLQSTWGSNDGGWLVEYVLTCLHTEHSVPGMMKPSMFQ